MNHTAYVVISPVRDEAQHIETTIRSMVRQTVRPAQWIIVDDGSTDGTLEIIHRYAAVHHWITPMHKPASSDASISMGRGHRACRAKEIEAFYAGYEELNVADWEFIAKIDGDIGFEPDYFEQCFLQFAREPLLGIAGGEICNIVDGEIRPEPTPRFHVRGATKIYRRPCWEKIGGVLRGPGWDTLDEVKANMLGWRTRTVLHLKVAHYRPTGSANGIWMNFVKNGLWSYMIGYHPLFIIARSMRQLFRPPYFVASVAILYGFIKGYVGRLPQAPDSEVIAFLRRQQLRRLFCLSNVWQ
jgi:glycosyltransferase involved in cell wall biosynthesis